MGTDHHHPDAFGGGPSTPGDADEPAPPSAGHPRERCHDPYLRCALYGAAQAALGVRGCCVLAHSPQGCFQLVEAAFGWKDSDYTETLTLCTKLCEDEIVHGGEDLLERTILEACDLDVPVMFLPTACGPEIVGDDVTAVCEHVAPRVGVRVVPVLCAGFRGDRHLGTDIALEAMLEQLLPDEPPLRRPHSVCLLAPHSASDVTGRGGR